MKKFLAFIFTVVLLSISTQAASTSYLFGTGGVTNLIDGFATANSQLTSISLANASGSAITVNVYNAPETADAPADLEQTIAAWTGFTQYETNIVESITNFLGVVQSRTNTVRYWSEQTYGPYTNDYKIVNTITVPASSSITWTPSETYIMDVGTVLEVSATNITATVNYISR